MLIYVYAITCHYHDYESLQRRYASDAADATPIFSAAAPCRFAAVMRRVLRLIMRA